MEARLKISAMIVSLTLGLCAFAGSARAFDLFEKIKNDFSAINEKGEQDRARIRGEAQVGGGAQTGGIIMAVQPEASQSKPTQLIVSKDKRVAAAMDEALPTIRKVLSIHQCIQDPQSLRQLNVFAVPGVDMVQSSGGLPAYGFPNSQFFMKFHDRNKCVSLTTIDQWAMPALNALLFRAVYFAEDSGETVNFLYLFKKVDDGSWKISQLEKGR
ncbi:MAG: hypothetical protein ACYC2E_16025 [Sulfuricella sp.]